MGGHACALGKRRPVNTARPRLAEIPQKNVAPAMYRYPRSGCLACKHLVEALGIESDHHLVSYHHRWRRAALVFVYQLLDRLGVAAHVSIFELDTSLREVSRYDVAGWSARLREYNDLLHHLLRLLMGDKRLHGILSILDDAGNLRRALQHG